MSISNDIGNNIKNVSTFNDKGNINFDIKVHGEWFRVVDCPAHLNTLAERRQFVNDHHLKGIRETIFNKENPVDNIMGLDNFSYKVAMDLQEERREDFKKRGIKAW